MLEKITMIDAVFNQISKFEQILSYLQTSKPKNFGNSDPKVLVILIYHTYSDILQLHLKIFNIAGIKMLKYAIFLSKVLFFTFLPFSAISFFHPYLQNWRKLLKLWAEICTRHALKGIIQTLCGVFWKKNFCHFLAKNVSLFAIFA